MKNKFYRIISLVLSVLILATACICPAVVNADTDVSGNTKVVYIETTNSGPFGQIVSVEAGETYVFKFSLSNEITPTVAVNNKDQRWVAISGITSTEVAKDTTAAGYTTYTYEVKMPDTLSVDSAIVGIKLGGTKKGYFFNASLYKKSDSAKTEMFVNGNFATGNLNQWVYKYMTFSNKNYASLKFEAESGNISETGETFVEIVDFKSTTMYETTRVLYIKSSHAGPIGQIVDLTAGETYVFSFALSNELTVKDIRLHDRNSRYINLSGYTVGTPVTDTTSSLYTTYTYEVTLDATDFTATSALFGVRLNGTSDGGYLFNASLYKKSDANKTEMFVNNDFANNSLDNWCYKYMGFGNAEKGLKGLQSATFSAESTSLNAEGETYIEVKDIKDTPVYEPDLQPEQADTNVVYVNARNSGPFGQGISVVPGETYVFTYSISNDLSASVAVNDKNSRHNALTKGVTIGTPLTNTTSDKFTTYSYEISFAQSFSYTSVFMGLKFSGTKPYTGYVFNFSMYKKSDPAKTELFSNGNFKVENLDKWYYKYMTFSAGKNALGLNKATINAESGKLEETGDVTLELKKAKDTPIYDENFDAGMVPPVDPNAPVIPVAPAKMLQINSNHKGVLGTQFECVAGETYTFKFAMSDTADFSVVLFDKDARYLNLGAQATLISTDAKAGYKYYEYQVVVPTTYTKNTAIVGFIFNTLPVEAYLFDASLYKTSDTEKTELLANGKFENGYLNTWLWKYTTFGNSTNLTEKTFQEDGKDITVKVVDFDESVMAPDTTPKMLHINSQNAGPIGQLLTANANEAFTVTLAVSNNLIFDIVVNDGSSRHKALDAKVEFVNGVDKGKYSIWTYEVTMPSDLVSKTNNVLLGVKFKGAAPYDGYLTNFSVYKSLDTAKTELLTNGDFMSGVLDNWRFKYTNFGGTNNPGLSSHSFKEDDKDVTLEIVPFDVSVMAEASANFPDPSPKMLYINSYNAGPIGQQVTVEGGAEYIINFDISNNLKFDIAVNDREQRHAATSNIKTEYVNGVDNGRYTTYTYKITMPTVVLSTKTGNETDKVIVGIKLKGAELYQGYLANVSLYKADDATKTNMFKNGDFLCGFLDGWVFKYTNFTSGEKLGLSSDTFTEDDRPVTLEVVKFDENRMQDVAAELPNTEPQMLYVETTNAGPIGQQVTVEPGATYTLKFAISNNMSFDVTVNDSQRRHTTTAGVEIAYVNGEDMGRYTVYTYSLKMPNPIMSNKTESPTDTVIVGIKFKGTKPYKGYIFDFEFYKATDDTKNNMFKNSDFFSATLDGWYYKYVNFTSGSKLGLSSADFYAEGGNGENDTYLEVVDRDTSIMEDVSAALPDFSDKMIYFKNGALSQPFSAWVDCTPGKKFIISYSIYATDEVLPHLNANGLRGNLNGNLEKLSEVKHDNYTTYTYRVTVPADYDDDLIFLGFRMPFYAEGYLFDLKCYAEGDENQKSAWKNGEFVYGFNEWIWGWTVTWFTQAGNQLKEWSDGMNTIKLVPYDVSQIDALIAEINRDDGEWWKPSDIIEKADDEKGIANVKGTFKDQNGTPIGNVTMILKSLDNTYKTVTNEKGEFAFKNVVADYYELFYVNTEGEEVLTDFAYPLENGDTATLTVVTDTTELSKVETSNLKGAVYTADLKVVSNLKVNLRGFGEVVTDKDGSFTFADVPVGKYELYTVLEDGSEYIFREVEIKENVDLSVKLKYAPEVESVQTEEEGFNWLWIIVACGAVVLIAAGTVLVIVLKKKNKKA